MAHETAARLVSAVPFGSSTSSLDEDVTPPLSRSGVVLGVGRAAFVPMHGGGSEGAFCHALEATHPAGDEPITMVTTMAMLSH